jgi:putative transposase
MSTHRRKFSDEEKLAILQQANKIGVTATMREHSLSYSVFTKWKQKFMRNEPGMPLSMTNNKTRSELKQLNEENMRLKKIIADQALQLEKKDEELKKISMLYAKR